MRATLHDELMREAGFETDYHRELEQQRERRRHITVRTAIRAVWLVLIAAGVIDLWAHHFSGIPKPVAATAVAVLVVVRIGDFVKNKLFAVDGGPALMGDPRPNWWILNRISLMPAAGIFLVGAGVVQSNAWLIAGGAATAATGTWLTMRRLTGRISERSLAWVLVDTTIVLAGAAVVFALHLSGVALAIAVGVPAIASDLIATAVTGVAEVR